MLKKAYNILMNLTILCLLLQDLNFLFSEDITGDLTALVDDVKGSMHLFCFYLR